MGVWSTVAGAADWAAGSTDEAVARTFDDEQGGGILTGTVETVVNSNVPLATATSRWGSDELQDAGTDLARGTFDAEAGGGLSDEAAEIIKARFGGVGKAAVRQFDNEPGGGFADPGTVVGGLLGNRTVRRYALLAVVAFVSVNFLQSAAKETGAET